jgi:hypothetical protein
LIILLSGFSEGDDRVGSLLHLDHLAERILRGKKPRRNVVADQSDGAREFDIVDRDVAAVGDRILVRGQEMFVRATKGDAGRALSSAVDCLCDSVAIEDFQADDITRALHQPLIMHRLLERDVPPQLETPPPRPLAAAVVHREFGELEHVRAEETEPGLDRRAQRAHRRHHADHRKYADRDAEHGQHRAQLVHAQRTDRHFENFSRLHQKGSRSGL